MMPHEISRPSDERGEKTSSPEGMQLPRKIKQNELFQAAVDKFDPVSMWMLAFSEPLFSSRISLIWL